MTTPRKIEAMRPGPADMAARLADARGVVDRTLLAVESFDSFMLVAEGTFDAELVAALRRDREAIICFKKQAERQLRNVVVLATEPADIVELAAGPERRGTYFAVRGAQLLIAVGKMAPDILDDAGAARDLLEKIVWDENLPEVQVRYAKELLWEPNMAFDYAVSEARRLHAQARPECQLLDARGVDGQDMLEPARKPRSRRKRRTA